MAQNDTHVALIILTTQMWGGGGGGDYWWKKLFRAKFCVPAPSAPTSVLTPNKGPDTEPHFSNPPPPSAGVHVTPPPPPRRAIFRLPNSVLPRAAEVCTLAAHTLSAVNSQHPPMTSAPQKTARRTNAAQATGVMRQPAARGTPHATWHRAAGSRHHIPA